MSDQDEFERVDPKEEGCAQCQTRTSSGELIQRKKVVRSVRPGRACLAYEVSPSPP